MTKQEFIDKLGFKEMNHFTIMDNIEYPLSRNRSISVGCAGTPNENVWLCQHDINDYKKITDLVCISNFDYDGLISEDRMKSLINLFLT